MSTQTQSPSNAGPFKRIVVLMMENHSFDHLLGWVPGVGTLDPTKDCQMDSNGKEHHVGKITAASMECGRANAVDTNHYFSDVIDQLYGVTPPDTTKSWSMEIPPTGGDFLTNNEDKYGGTGQQPLDEYMACYTPEQVPVLAALATTYTTCARWFSSVPGPTGPNRLVTHCATSGGYNGASYNYSPSFNPPMKSIFSLLRAANNTWSIYWDGSFSTAYALEDVHGCTDNFRLLSSFSTDVQAMGTAFPQYVFVTPSLGGYRDGNTSYPPSSMHPAEGPGTVADGEALIKTVYEALASNLEVWNETLLLIVFDEHGGFYDSVMPPARLPDGGNANSNPPWSGMPTDNQVMGYDFMNYGVRVPAIVISAWHPQHVDQDTVFEHSSIPATVEALFGLPSLGCRDLIATTFHDRWPLSFSPAKPISLPPPYTGGDSEQSSVTRAC